MKLYFYYLDDGKLKRSVQTNVRKNKFQYVIPADGKTAISSIFREQYFSIEFCDTVQVDYSIYRWSPFIVSACGDLDKVPRLAVMLLSVSESCAVVNSQIKGIVKNE